MSPRGVYGSPRVGGDPGCGTSATTWIVRGLLVGGAVLWAKHQSDQIAKLSVAAKIPEQSFTESLRADARTLPTRARTTFRGIAKRLGAGKGT